MYSIVIPIYNEEQAVVSLYLSLKRVMDRPEESYEIIFVDDCSTDGSLKMLKSIVPVQSDLVILSLSKHSGQSAAMQAGFDACRGELIITMDGDLQNSPFDIPKLIDKLNEGFDVVCGWRYERKDPKVKLLVSKIAGYLRRIITKEEIHDFGCTLRLFKREVLDGIYFSRGMHRFFTLIMIKLGYRIGEVKTKHYPRKYGKSKYNICNRTIEPLIDFIRLNLFGVHCLKK